MKIGHGFVKRSNTVLKSESRDNTVAFCLHNCSIKAVFTRGWIIPKIARFSIFAASSDVGGFTLATTVAFHTSSVFVDMVAPAALYCKGYRDM